MTGVLKTILFLIVIYYAWKFLFRLFFPMVLKKAMDRAQRNMEDRMRDARSHQAEQGHTAQEGEVIIRKSAAAHRKKSTVAQDEGEYVDFEEIKE